MQHAGFLMTRLRWSVENWTPLTSSWWQSLPLSSRQGCLISWTMGAYGWWKSLRLNYQQTALHLRNNFKTSQGFMERPEVGHVAFRHTSGTCIPTTRWLGNFNYFADVERQFGFSLSIHISSPCSVWYFRDHEGEGKLPFRQHSGLPIPGLYQLTGSIISSNQRWSTGIRDEDEDPWFCGPNQGRLRRKKRTATSREYLCFLLLVLLWTHWHDDRVVKACEVDMFLLSIPAFGLFLHSKYNQRTNGPVNAHLISWPSKAQNIQSLEKYMVKKWPWPSILTYIHNLN